MLFQNCSDYSEGWALPSITSLPPGIRNKEPLNIINYSTMEGPAIQNRNVLQRIFIFKRLSKSTIVELISLLLIILFLYTGISKMMEYTVFKEQIAESPILKPVASLIAWVLPLAEFVVSALLIIPRFRLKGLYASFALMLSFTIYIIAIMTFNKELPCSCGGIIALLSWQGHLIFNCAFIILAAIGILLERKIAAIRSLTTITNMSLS